MCKVISADSTWGVGVKDLRRRHETATSESPMQIEQETLAGLSVSAEITFDVVDINLEV